MKLNFESVLSHTLIEFEGGYANDKDDSGGETFAGVSRVNTPTGRAGLWWTLSRLSTKAPARKRWLYL
jgi:lysozyme family protein